MKADLSALKDQMASITEAMLKLHKTIEDNAMAAASNMAREAEGLDGHLLHHLLAGDSRHKEGVVPRR